MLIEAFVSLPSAEGAVQERNGSLMRNYSHLFDYHHEDHNTKPGRTSSNWTRDELRSPLLLSEGVTGISKSLPFPRLGPNVILLPSSREWALEKILGVPHSEEWGATLQKDSPDLVRRLPRPFGLGTLSAGAPGKPRAHARRLGAALGARSQRGPGDAPRAPWLQITGAALGRPAREPACSLARDHRPGLRTPRARRWRGPSPWGEPWLARSHGEPKGQAGASPNSPEKCLPQMTRWHQQGGVLPLKRLCRHTLSGHVIAT